MKISSRSQAKKFFIDRIILQAQKEGVSLSDAEKYMLSWTETGEGFEFNQELTDKHYEHSTDLEFEKKISALIKHAYQTDVEKDYSLLQTYWEAYSVLSRGDHYLLVMIDSAFKSSRSDIRSGEVKDRLFLILTALGITLIPLFIIIYFDFTGRWVDFAISCVVYLGCYFGYSAFMLKKVSALSRFKIILFQIVVATISITAYALIFKFNVLDIEAHPNYDRSFRDIVIFPLLAVSIMVLDFWLKEGIIYDGLMDYIERFNKFIKNRR